MTETSPQQTQQHRRTDSRSGKTTPTTTALRVSGAADRFHRVQRGTTTTATISARNILSTNTADLSTASLQIAAAVSPPTSGNAPDLQNIDRAAGGLPRIASSGFHMPPEVLGQNESAFEAASTTINNENHGIQKSESSSRRPSALADLNKSVRKRMVQAVKALKSKAAAAAAVKGVALSSSSKVETINLTLDSSMFTFVIYKGMEVIFSNTSHHTVLGVCSRTNYVFQQLNLASGAPIVSITSDSISGMVVIAHQDGIIQTYTPMQTDPVHLRDEYFQRINREQPKSVYGRFRWIGRMTINALDTFYQPGEVGTFLDRRQAKQGELLDISSSYDYKLLVAHRQQLAVFDVAPPSVKSSTPQNSSNRNTIAMLSSSKCDTATLSWTTLLPAKVVTAKMSGDGQAIVVVLDQPNEDGQFGAMTFIHDNEDGSQAAIGRPNTIQRSESIGMVYKLGPFLQHSTPVNRISFRGLGHLTPSGNSENTPGNDLLLTYCEEESAVRIFNQNQWKQIIMWAAPPNSRADWIRGSSSFSLGDLEPHKKSASSRILRPGSRRPSNNSSELSNTTGGIIAGLRNNVHGPGVPTSSAGAWIAEISFRGAYPALRLSRLCYMKRGSDDSQAAHFESVAAILPAGSIVAGSVLNSDDMGLSIQGVWPAWNPWLSEPSGNPINETLSGSAMQFLGLSFVSPTNNGMFGDSFPGGIHGPPSELRIVSSHPEGGHVVLMEFPLWGDDDYGAMELGSPVRRVLAMSEVSSIQTKKPIAGTISDSMDYECSRLCAKTQADGRSISLLWRKEGSMSLYSSDWRDQKSVHVSNSCNIAVPKAPDLLLDLSLIPVPLALPPLRLPRGPASLNDDTIVALKWWPDESFGGPPLLVAITRSATLLVYEIPPPIFGLEPTMPSFDAVNSQSSVASGSHDARDAIIIDGGSDGDESSIARQEYDVHVTPHPDFGLGLRLESPMDGLPAIAGSFKKNPLNDGMLPAEKTGLIHLGDELLSVNGVSLENMTFDDIIATVRHVGAEVGPGEPLKMRFRPVPTNRSRKNSAVIQESFHVRPIETPNSVSPTQVTSFESSSHQRSTDVASLASVFLPGSVDAQQEFGRVLAVVSRAFPHLDAGGFPERFLVLPWNKSTAQVDNKRLRASALVIHGYSSKVEVNALELPSRTGLDKARILSLGVIDIGTSGASSTKDSLIRSMKYIALSGRRLCIMVADSEGLVHLLYLLIEKRHGKTDVGSAVGISHKLYRITNVGVDLQQFKFNSISPDVIAAIQKTEGQGLSIKVWHARPDSSSRQLEAVGAIKDEYFGNDYVDSTLSVEASISDSKLVDFCFLETGCLESFPTIVAFLTSEAVVYQRRGISHKWVPVLRLSYPSIPSSHASYKFDEDVGRLALDPPLETFPHILQSIRGVLSSYDEKNIIMSDWHPESLLSHICMNDRGAKSSLKGDVRRILLWLAEKIDDTSDDNFCPDVPLLVAPVSLWVGETLGKSVDTVDDEVVDNATSLVAAMKLDVGGSTDVDSQRLQHLLDVLTNGCTKQHVSVEMRRNSARNVEAKKDANLAAENSLPVILTALQPDELRVLKALVSIVLTPPNFGKLDRQSQLTLTLFLLHKQLKVNTNGSEPSSPRSTTMANYSSFYVKRQLSVSDLDKPKLYPQNASAGCLAALLSDYQEILIETIRAPGENLDWATVRDLRLPFWLRSDEKLRQISGEIGQMMYRESKDILQSAIFFIVAGKQRTLMNLAAADNTDSGRKFNKFLTTYDFTSERGRSAAEKNAFSLLRKNNYNAAAAFFLLGQPPMLKSAVETIATKMEDLDLAFLVARLVGNITTPSGSHFRVDGELGGFGGVLGGGGGYAVAGAPLADASRDNDSFSDWKRKLSLVGKRLIMDRCLSSYSDDSCFSAVLLLWLGRFDEASHWLTGLVNCSGEIAPCFKDDVLVPQLGSERLRARHTRDATISTINSFINIAAGPFLLKAMKANIRTTNAAILAISRAFARVGIDVAVIRMLKQFDNESTSDMEHRSDPTMETARRNINEPSPSGNAASSIFDEYDPTPVIRQPSQTQATSSIFDSYDVAPPSASRQAVPVASSSIFDSYETAPTSKMKSSAQGQMVSSIFDSFDIPAQPKQTPAPAPRSDEMSSIFDSFDAAPTPNTNPNTSGSGSMTSSIFDSFDVAPKQSGHKTLSSEAMVCRLDASEKPMSIPPMSMSMKMEELDEPAFQETSMIRTSHDLWHEWREDSLVDTAARRLVRELATLCAPYHSDRFEQSGENNPIVTSSASQVLQFHCDGEELMDEIRSILQTVSIVSGLEARVIVERAIRLLHSPHQFYRTLLVVLLLLGIREVELAEDTVRKTARSLIERCISKSFSNDHFATGKDCVAYLSHVSVHKVCARLSWQLELCLWVHRGGALPLSGLALNEAICAVRIGYLVASWSFDFEIQEAMVRQPPDCLVDEGAGRQLWTSLKIISGSSSDEKKVTGTGSGGWEFLVDCRRSEATELLRPRPTGCFIIRPHPEDHGVFTLSFKTNLIPTKEYEAESNGNSNAESGDEETKPVGKSPPGSRPIKRDDVVQHAIIRLSDSGFRCGSFGPFGTLMKLLEAVSASLPFDLRFDMPPTEGIIKDEGSKPSPNSIFLRKLAMHQAESANRAPSTAAETSKSSYPASASDEGNDLDDQRKELNRREKIGIYAELLLISDLRKQLSAVAAAEYDSVEWVDDANDDVESVGSLSDESVEIGVEQEYAIAARMLRPFLTWCRVVEIGAVDLLAPSDVEVASLFHLPISLKETETAIEISTTGLCPLPGGGDDVIRRMIQPGSGVEFRTLRLGEGGDCAMVVLFSKKEAVAWFLHNDVEKDEEDALERLHGMERIRVIEPVDLKLLAPKVYKKGKRADEEEMDTLDDVESGIRYRLVDPWEVEPLESREAETRGASLGREHLLAFSLSRVASSCEEVLRDIGGHHLLELWAATKGGISITKALATVHAPWKRSVGGDLLLKNGVLAEPSEYENAIREHLYRNTLYRRLRLPQRFMALIQVELLDLKNLSSPSGSLSLTVYSLLRLKRARSSAPLTSKARTLDSAATPPVKLSKTSGPNAPASWGSLVRFRFPLPENTANDGKSFDSDCESLFKGPPSVLQVSVYEKKFMSDSYLGGADVKLDGLNSGGQLEEWVPLKTESHGITWFARIRLTLRFELMCLAAENESLETLEELSPSVGLRRIKQLCSVGGAQMDLKKSVSTPDLLTYFESMVY